jgi:hypothetical protein
MMTITLILIEVVLDYDLIIVFYPLSFILGQYNTTRFRSDKRRVEACVTN